MIALEHLWPAGALWSLLLGGCSSVVENPSAYDSELFLCAEQHADRWQAELDTCRHAYEQDGSCGGLASFAGVVQGQSITVDSRLDNTVFEDITESDGAEVRSELKLNGASPYFRFRFKIWEIGGPLEGGERQLQVLGGRSPDPEPQPLADDYVRVGLRLMASSQSLESSALDGTLHLTVQRRDEQAGTFRLMFADDAIDGCFHAFHDLRQDSSGGGP